MTIRNALVQRDARWRTRRRLLMDYTFKGCIQVASLVFMDCKIERVSKPLAQVNAVKSAALRVVGPAHKVVDGYVEIIGQGD